MRIGVEYQPGRASRDWWSCPGPSLDSARAIVRRDLDYSDRFEMIVLADAPDGPSSGRGGAETRRDVNYGIYKALGPSSGSS